ncbi:MAG: hypothetical protein ACRENP_16915 [Longimicrobiales bacterium]
MKRAGVPVILLAALAAFAQVAAGQQQPPAKPLNPVGDYEFSTSVQGQTLSGTFSIVKQNDVLSGKIMSDMGEAPITSVKVEERKLTMVVVTPDGAEVTFVLNFEDDNKFAGTWASGGESAAITGKRKVA